MKPPAATGDGVVQNSSISDALTGRRGTQVEDVSWALPVDHFNEPWVPRVVCCVVGPKRSNFWTKDGFIIENE